MSLIELSLSSTSRRYRDIYHYVYRPLVCSYQLYPLLGNFILLVLQGT